MELRTYLREVWRYLFFILGAVLLVSLIAFVASNAAEKTYTAESRLVVTAGLGTDGTGTDSVLAAPGSARRTPSWPRRVPSSRT